jgi:hypothetical protein
MRSILIQLFQDEQLHEQLKSRFPTSGVRPTLKRNQIQLHEQFKKNLN